MSLKTHLESKKWQALPAPGAPGVAKSGRLRVKELGTNLIEQSLSKIHVSTKLLTFIQILEISEISLFYDFCYGIILITKELPSEKMSFGKNTKNGQKFARDGRLTKIS